MNIDSSIATDLRAIGAIHGHPRLVPDPALRGHHAVTTSDTTLVVRRSAARLKLEHFAPIHARRMARAVTGVAALLATLSLHDLLRDYESAVDTGATAFAWLAFLVVLYFVTKRLSAGRFRRRFARPRADEHVDTLENRAQERAGRLERLDGWSTGLALVGLACFFPFFGTVVLQEPNPYDTSAGTIVGVFGLVNMKTCALMSFVPALLLGSALAGLHGERPAWLRRLESTQFLAVAISIAVVAFGFASAVPDEVTANTLSATGKLARAALTQLAVTSFAVWTVLRLRRRDLRPAP